MPRAAHYTPPLSRLNVCALYHQARELGIPMPVSETDDTASIMALGNQVVVIRCPARIVYRFPVLIHEHDLARGVLHLARFKRIELSVLRNDRTQSRIDLAFQIPAIEGIAVGIKLSWPSRGKVLQTAEELGVELGNVWHNRTLVDIAPLMPPDPVFRLRAINICRTRSRKSIAVSFAIKDKPKTELPKVGSASSPVARCFARERAGRRRPANTAMMAMTTSSSRSVKARPECLGSVLMDLLRGA